MAPALTYHTLEQAISGRYPPLSVGSRGLFYGVYVGNKPGVYVEW